MPVIEDVLTLSLPDEAVNPEDSVLPYLPPSLKTSFEALEIVSFEDLYEMMMHLGRHWYKRLEGMDRQQAQAIVQWFRHSGRHIGEVSELFLLEAPSKQPSMSPASELVPWERLVVPENLTGQTGANRAPTLGSSLRVKTDREAIEAWWQARAMNPNTLSAYRKESERFYLWCLFERQKALSDILTEDASLYVNWIQQLGRTDEKTFNRLWHLPQAAWLTAKNTPRSSAAWRPFQGPLNPTSRRQALVVVRQLFNFLKRTGFLLFNPFDQVSTKVPILAGEDVQHAFADRSLTEAQWAAITSRLTLLAEGYPRNRMALILWLGKGLGLRASEMIALKAGWIRATRLGLKTQWTLDVYGKGGKARRLPLNQQGLEFIEAALTSRGEVSLAQANPDTLLLTNLGRGANAHAGLTRSGLYRVLEAFFERVALDIEITQPRDAAKLRASSTHWLRHTFAINALDKLDINVVQAALGHASVATTGKYLTPDEEKLAEAMQDMKL